MQFSNANNLLGIVQDTRFLCRSNSASYPLNAVVRNVNHEYYDVQRIIWESVVSWQYDDSNNSDLPRMLRTMTHDTQSYEIPSVAQRINRVEIQDNSSNWHKLKPLDAIKDLKISEREYLEDASLPIYYDLEGDMIVLTPPPHSGNCTMTSGLALYVDRNITLFTSASTTASPGFAPQFHRILSLGAALAYETDPSQRNLLVSMKDKMEKGLRKFYASRFGEAKPEIRPTSKREWRQYI